MLKLAAGAMATMIAAGGLVLAITTTAVSKDSGGTVTKNNEGVLSVHLGL